ncbi:MAG: hypothetical protein ACR2PG_08900 [Hyphomicrobiaceae bacterium]
MNRGIVTSRSKIIVACAAALALIVALAYGSLWNQGELPKEALEVSENFVNVYYQKKDLDGALRLSTGAARKRVAGELAELKAAGASNTDQSTPTVNVTYIEYKRSNNGNYVTEWQVESSAGEKLSSNVTLEKTDDGWRVADVSEDET